MELQDASKSKLQIVVGLDHEVCDGLDWLGTRTQYPLCLAHALTVHKSQGKTLPHVHIEGRAADFFVEPLLYVAIFRVSCLSERTLSQDLHIEGVNIEVNKEVQRFYREFVRHSEQ